MATKVVKAKVIKVKRKKQLSKGASYPWEVRFINRDAFGLSKQDACTHNSIEEFKTRKEVEAFIKRNPRLVAPVIVNIVIPPMEYQTSETF